LATPRKHWFRVEDSIRGQGWDNDVLAMAVRIMALLNTQWARNGITDPDEACRITLGPGVLADCAGCQSVARARSVLRRLEVGSRLTWNASGTDTSIYWPKYAEVQELRTPRLPESLPRAARESPSPLPLPQTLPQTQTEDKTKTPARVARGPVKTDAPEALSQKDQEALEAWCKERWPSITGRLLDLVSACFTFHRSKGNRHANWYATAQTWVRNEAEGRFGKQAVNGTAVVTPKAKHPDHEELRALSRRKLLLMPTLEYWREWVSAGKPEERFWWVEPDGRAELEQMH